LLFVSLAVGSCCRTWCCCVDSARSLGLAASRVCVASVTKSATANCAPMHCVQCTAPVSLRESRFNLRCCVGCVTFSPSKNVFLDFFANPRVWRQYRLGETLAHRAPSESAGCVGFNSYNVARVVVSALRESGVVCALCCDVRATPLAAHSSKLSLQFPQPSVESEGTAQ